VCKRAHTRFSSSTKSSGPALRHQRRCFPRLRRRYRRRSGAFGPGLSPPCLVGLCGSVPCFMSTILGNTSSSLWSSSPSLSRRQSRYVFEQTFSFRLIRAVTTRCCHCVFPFFSCPTSLTLSGSKRGIIYSTSKSICCLRRRLWSSSSFSTFVVLITILLLVVVVPVYDSTHVLVRRDPRCRPRRYRC
jgi:hypothetical protein